MPPRPPMFAPITGGTPAQQYMHRARMFRRAAIDLSDYSNGEQFLPKYALLTHAIELTLKAFSLHSIPSNIKKPHNHDLNGWYKLALNYGFPQEPRIAQNIDELHLLHFIHYTRYPKELSSPIPDLSIIADETADYLLEQCTLIINPR